jgi:uncharacterized protein
MSGFIETWTGAQLKLPDPDPTQIRIEDIAHALCQVPRFAGHLDEFYSVAEHSLNVAAVVWEKTNSEIEAFQALLHDATEAYISDIPTPFKLLMPDYQRIEENLWGAIATKYGVPVELYPSVKEADRIMLMTERDALKPHASDWGEKYESTPRLSPEAWNQYSDIGQVEEDFLALFHALHDKVNTGNN